MDNFMTNEWDSDIPVIEGFICPVCKADLEADHRLLSHFQEEHAEEQDLIKTFKELFGRAKKKILKPDFQPEASKQYAKPNVCEYNEPQEFGRSINYTDIFIRIRSERVQRLSVPLNQLVLRLDKLLDNMPSDLLKKKAHEQSIVSWIDGTTVTRCPECAGSFHLARRKHHCRTCGGIMCNDCSHFIPLTIARKILNKEDASEAQNAELKLRLCIHCVTLLEMKETKWRLSQTNPIVSQLYSLISQAREEIYQHLTPYLKMYNSLNAGESTYNLTDAQLLRIKIIKLLETMDSVSNKIGKLGSEDSGLELRLQAAVRSGVTNFIRTQLTNLPVLPSEEQLIEKQERRKEEAIRRIEEEQLRELRKAAAASRSQPVPSTSPTEPSSSEAAQPFVLGQGWVPGERKKKSNDKEDPLIEQMNIIRAYIKEARSAQRFDEVESLEQNLSELKKEFWKNQDIQDSRDSVDLDSARSSSFENGS